MDHKINVQEPWFTLIKKGIKTVEGRLNKGKFCNLKINDTITWNNSSDDIYKNLKSSQLASLFKTKIVRITKYDSFYKYLIFEGLKNTLPSNDINSIESGLNIYYKFYSPEKEKEHGVLAIELELI